MALRVSPARFLLAPLLAAGAAVLGLVAGVEPRIAIALALGCAFVLVAFASLSAGLAIFGFLGFIEVVPAGGPFLSVTKLVGLLLALSWLALVTTETGSGKNFITEYPVATILLIVFVGWVALSATWAQDSGVALGAAGRFFLGAFLFMIVFSGVRNPREAGNLVTAFLAGASTAAVYGMLSPSSVDAGRLGTGTLDPNYLAAVLVSGTALAVAVFAINGKRPLVRVLAVFGGLLCLTGVLLTLSRGGLIALGVSLIAAILIAGRWRLPVAALAAVLALGVVIYFGQFASPQSRDRVTNVTSGQTRIEEGRTSLWQVAWRAFDAHPVAGIGGANFPVSSRQYLLQPGLVQRGDQILRNQQVHNSYLGVLSELGLVGLALFGSIIAFALASLLRAIRAFRRNGDRAMEALTMAVTVALVGDLAADFFISAEYNKQLWLLLGLGPALLWVARNPREGARI